MQPEIGKIYDGKVTGITKFGAFVDIGEGTSGMVHISEVSNTFVNDINDHLNIGQEVKVKVIGINEGKVSLSIKKALGDDRRPPRREPRQGRQDGAQGDGSPRGGQNGQGGQGGQGSSGRQWQKDSDKQGDRPGGRPSGRSSYPRTLAADFSGKPAAPASFEDMLSKFKASSDEKMGDIKRNMDSKRRNTSRKR